MSRVFVTKAFARFARRESLDDDVLLRHIEQADRGLIDAKLAGCLIKIRVTRRNEGKSGGYRVLVAYLVAQKAIYLYGFAKNEMANVDSHRERELEYFGSILLGLNEDDLRLMEVNGELREIVWGQNGHE